jgi:hypothetical protein
MVGDLFDKDQLCAYNTYYSHHYVLLSMILNIIRENLHFSGCPEEKFFGTQGAAPKYLQQLRKTTSATIVATPLPPKKRTTIVYI